MKITVTTLISSLMTCLIVASFAVTYVLSVTPPYLAVAFWGLAYVLVSFISIPLSIVLGVVASRRKNRHDLIWAAILFVTSAGPIGLIVIGGIVFDIL